MTGIPEEICLISRLQSDEVLEAESLQEQAVNPLTSESLSNLLLDYIEQ